MALVRNNATYAVDLSTGRLVVPGEIVNADVDQPHEQSLIRRGVLTVTDGTVDPPAPTSKTVPVVTTVAYSDPSEQVTLDISGEATDAELAAAIAAIGGRFRGAYASLSTGAVVKANDVVTNPSGALVSRIADGTISGSYNSANWTLLSAGSGVPAGGTTGQVLKKNSSTDGDASWGTIAAGLTPTAVKTANYTAAAGDLVRVDTTSGAVTVTLPAAAAGATVGVKLTTLGGTNAVTVAAAGSDVFNKSGGPTTLSLSLLNQGVVLAAISGVWVVQADDLALSQLDARYQGLGFFDVTASPYNADKTGSADCTAAIQAAVNAAAAAGGGTVFFPRGIYKLSSAPTSGTVTGLDGVVAYSGQVLFPTRKLDVGPMTIRLLGESPSPMALWGPQIGDDVPVEVGGSILRSTATSGRMFDAIPAVSSGQISGRFTNLNVIVDSLTIRCPNDPQVGGLGLKRCLAAAVLNTTVGVNASAGSISQPTGSVVGIELPGLTNGAQVSVYRTQVYGFPVGLSHSEHATLNEFVAYLNLVGIQVDRAYHLSNYLRVGMYENQTHMKSTYVGGGGDPATLVGNISVEQGTVGWYANRVVIDDVNNQIGGKLGFLLIRTGTGYESRLPVLGSENLSLSDLRIDSIPGGQQVAVRNSFTARDSIYAVPTGESNHSMLPWGGVWGISSNKAYNVSAGGNSALTALARSANYTISADVTTSPTTNRVQSGLVCRFNHISQFFAVALRIDSGAPTGEVMISKDGSRVAGSAVALAPNTTYALSVQVTATQLIVSINGSVVHTYTLSGAEQTAYNGFRRAGLYMYRGGAQDDGGSRFANLVIA